MAAFNGGEAEKLSGLAGEIRSAVESDTIDLANYTETRMKDLMLCAFSKPLDAPTKMIHFQFIVGGGKLVRQKYNDDMLKWACAALRELGFSEDKGAAETFDSMGTFKTQHDTGQNLKYLHVFPRVACANAKAAGSSAAEAPDLPDQKTPEWMIASAGLDVFKQMLKSKVESWRQKKKLVTVLQEASESFQAVEQKMVSGQPLTPREQLVYDANSGNDAEKMAWLQSEIKEMCDTGRLTASEQKELLVNIANNIASLEEEKAKATADGKPKLVEKIAEKIAAATTRKVKVAEGIPGGYHPRLKHGDEIQKLRVKLLGLIALEERPKGTAMTIAELQILSEKPDVEAAIDELENASRGWFEAQEDFTCKVELEVKEAQVKYKAKLKAAQGSKKSLGSGAKGKTGTQKIGGGGGGGGYGGGSSSANVWNTIGVARKPVGGGGGGGGKSGGGQSGGFAAAFGGDDSDSD